MASTQPHRRTTDQKSSRADLGEPATSEYVADIKLFWGAEIYRLEYLVHLLETGRIKDESTGTAASALP